MDEQHNTASIINALHLRIIALEQKLDRMQIERRLTTLETIQSTILEREHARIHYEKI